MNEEDHAIISRYGAEYRGIVQYYLLAGDVWRLSRLHWGMLTSMLKTLAGKYESSVSKMARKYAATIETPHGPRKCMQVTVDRGEGRKPLVATFGGIPLRRQKNAVLADRQPDRPTHIAESWSADSWRDGARSAATRKRCRYIRSASSLTSAGLESQTDPSG